MYCIATSVLVVTFHVQFLIPCNIRRCAYDDRSTMVCGPASGTRSPDATALSFHEAQPIIIIIIVIVNDNAPTGVPCMSMDSLFLEYSTQL